MTDRNDLGSNLNGMIILSVLLHALMLSIFLLSPSLPSKKWTFGPTYTVALVEDAGTVSNGAPSTPTAAMSRELTATQKLPSTIKKIDEPRAWSLIKPQSLSKSESTDNARREQAIEALKKKLASSETSSSRPVPASSTQGEVDAKMNAYYARIWSRIKGQWALPRGILPENRLESVLNVVVLRDGAIAGVSFEKRSGNAYFDESAVRAIRKASPLPPLPDWIKDNKMEIGLRFRSTDFR